MEKLFLLFYINSFICEKNCGLCVEKNFYNKIVYFFHNLMYTNRSLFILWGDGGMNVDIIWTKFLDQIKDELTSLSFDTWFADTTLHRLENGKAYIIVPMPIHKKHLIDNYSDLIVKTLMYTPNSFIWYVLTCRSRRVLCNYQIHKHKY